MHKITKFCFALLAIVFSTAANAQQFQTGTITTQNYAVYSIWITIYDLAKLSHLDYGCVPPGQAKDWQGGGRYLAGYYHVRAEVKSVAGCAGDTIADTSVRVSVGGGVTIRKIEDGVVGTSGGHTVAALRVDPNNGNYYWGDPIAAANAAPLKIVASSAKPLHGDRVRITVEGGTPPYVWMDTNPNRGRRDSVNRPGTATLDEDAARVMKELPPGLVQDPADKQLYLRTDQRDATFNLEARDATRKYVKATFTVSPRPVLLSGPERVELGKEITLTATYGDTDDYKFEVLPAVTRREDSILFGTGGAPNALTFTGVKPGTVTVVVTSGSTQASRKITVPEPPKFQFQTNASGMAVSQAQRGFFTGGLPPYQLAVQPGQEQAQIVELSPNRDGGYDILAKNPGVVTLVARDKLGAQASVQLTVSAGQQLQAKLRDSNMVEIPPRGGATHLLVGSQGSILTVDYGSLPYSVTQSGGSGKVFLTPAPGGRAWVVLAQAPGPVTLSISGGKSTIAYEIVNDAPQPLTAVMPDAVGVRMIVPMTIQGGIPPYNVGAIRNVDVRQTGPATFEVLGVAPGIGEIAVSDSRQPQQQQPRRTIKVMPAALEVRVASATLRVGPPTAMQVQGGMPPYNITQVAGSGLVGVFNSSGNIQLRASRAGTVTIQTTDATGNSVRTELMVQ